MAGTRDLDRAQFQGIFSKLFFGSFTVDVASLIDAAGTSTPTLTLPGVALGDMVLGISFGVSTQGMTVTANVTAADTVLVRVQNETGGTIDLASTTVRVLVGRPNVDLLGL